MKYKIIFFVFLLMFSACTSGRYRSRIKKDRKYKKVIMQEEKLEKDKTKQLSEEKLPTMVRKTEAIDQKKIKESLSSLDIKKTMTEDHEAQKLSSIKKGEDKQQKVKESIPEKDKTEQVFNQKELAEGKEFKWRKVENNAFRVGEKLTFAIKWGAITAGYSTLEVREILEINGRKVYHIVAKTRSTSFFDKIYKVRDTVETFVDVESICSWRFRKELNEGKYHSLKETIYDQKNHLAITNGNVVKVVPFVQDVLSALYYLRTHDIEVGEKYDIDVNTDKKNWALRVKVSKEEIVKTKAGKFRTVCIEPVLREEGIFKQKGRLWIWVTNDSRKMPVLMESKIMVGSIVAVLVKLKK
ncbi:DUF3108 domain-containing protein [bacterium]|nr:DUF3108 domain-containing protein [bacterium]